MITNSLENAQKKVEGRNFEIRKYLLDYDDVQNKQREVVYGIRNKLLRDEEISEILSEISEEVFLGIENVFSWIQECNMPLVKKGMEFDFSKKRNGICL